MTKKGRTAEECWRDFLALVARHLAAQAQAEDKRDQEPEAASS